MDRPKFSEEVGNGLWNDQLEFIGSVAYRLDPGNVGKHFYKIRDLSFFSSF